MHILSLNYLVFAAAVFAVYYLCPLKWRHLVLLAASIGFYALSGWQGMVYLLVTAAVTYLAALALPKLKGKWAGLLLAVTLILGLGAMVVLKYAPALLAGLSGGRLTLPELIQPLGLSWFTFQSAGYVIDVSRGKIKPEKNPLKYLLFVSFFPQMLQGPISTWTELGEQLIEGHRLDPVGVTMGFQLMLWGYFKKLVLADRLAPMMDYLLRDGEKPGYMILLGAAVYMIRLYGDFSGGMDIIRGTAMTLGITMPENFRRPFFSLSVGEYWRRWHISLGAWFRSYVFYPFTMSAFGGWLGRLGVRLLGKKTGRLLPSALGTLVIFVLIGLWHGAHWNAAVYGAYFGILMGAAILLDGRFRKLKKRMKIQEKKPLWKAFCMVRTWLLLMAAQFFAFTNSPAQGFSLLAGSLSGWGMAASLADVMPTLEWIIAGVAGIVLLTVDVLCHRGVDVNRRLADGNFLIRWCVMLLLIVAVAVFGCYGVGTGNAAFVYTQF